MSDTRPAPSAETRRLSRDLFRLGAAVGFDGHDDQFGVEVAAYRPVGDRHQISRTTARHPAPAVGGSWPTLLTVGGQAEKAREQLSSLDAEQSSRRQRRRRGSLFSADHDIGLAEGLAAARSEWDRRKSVFVADALAWQLHANGRDVDALFYADQALRLGTANALFHFHRSQIRLFLGDRDAATRRLAGAVDLNLHFSILHSPTAHEQLLRLPTTTKSLPIGAGHVPLEYCIRGHEPAVRANGLGKLVVRRYRATLSDTTLADPSRVDWLRKGSGFRRRRARARSQFSTSTRTLTRCGGTLPGAR